MAGFIVESLTTRSFDPVGLEVWRPTFLTNFTYS